MQVELVYYSVCLLICFFFLFLSPCSIFFLPSLFEETNSDNTRIMVNISKYIYLILQDSLVWGIKLFCCVTLLRGFEEMSVNHKLETTNLPKAQVI